MIIECKYLLSDGDIPKFEGCAINAVIDEHIDCISNAFRSLNVTIEVDDEWGFCRLIAVNGQELKE